MLEFNISLIGQRGGNVCGQDHFVMVACEHCRSHYLYNEALKDIYYDADDLSRRFFRIEGINLPPCKGCGSIKWLFSEHPLTDVEVQLGAWGWVLE